MFVKLQHLDTNCIPVLHPLKTSKPNINGGVSLPLPCHRTEREFEQLTKKHQIPPQKQSDFDKRVVFHTPKSNPNGSVETPGRKKGTIEKDRAVKGRIWLRRHTLEKEKSQTNCTTQELNGNEEVKKVHTNCSTKVVPENGVVKKGHTKCSSKWARYGGCIPAILDTLERVTHLDEAFKPWELSLSNKERTIILKEQKSWQRAMEIFNWFKKKGCYELNVIHYNIMIRILGKAQRWEELEILLEEMQKIKIESINSTYGTLIDVYSKGGFREKAIHFLDTMNKKKIEPDEVTMGIVLQMYKISGQIEKSEEFFKNWSTQKTVPIDTNPQGNISLSSYTYNTLIDTYGKAGRLEDASQMFDEMLKRGIVPNTVTLNSMIHMLGNHGQLDKVESLMQKMEQFQCVPDTRTFNILISVHIKHDNIILATKYFKKMKNSSLFPDSVSYRTLIYAFSIRHMVDEVEEYVSEMDERGLEIDEFTQSSITRMYIDIGMIEKSLLWFKRFHITGKMSPECYSATIDAFGSRGHVPEAEEVFKCCQEQRNPKVLEFNVMIKAYGINKRFNDMCRVIDSMEENNVTPDKCSYNSVIQMLAGSNHPKTAVIYLRKMWKSDSVTDCVPYCAVISGFVKLGQLGPAIELFEEMIGLGIEPDVVVYGVLINAYADIGNVEEALRYVNAMGKTGLQMNPVICNSLIKLYTKVGCLRKAEEAYRTLLLLSADSDVYSSNCMIDLYTERSMVKQAEEIFDKLRKSGTANEFSYAMMLCMYKKIGSFEDAFEIAKKMRELGFMRDLLSYNHVLGLYALDGRFKEAVMVFKEMIDSGVEPNDSSFKYLGVVLMKRGVAKDAVLKLECMRKNDYASGLKAWQLTLDSVVGMVYRDISD
ncbi:hypothetical protein LXL04_003431 [Taraxacum kok-saghyz]